ncbi:ATP-binding protein [Alicyclobacillus sp. SO9]|uniref:ATP-binding protein n=1 Tax=Alicyclobacillus sp. SO9 TaxID=2665646 RepID=UPI0018E86A65|nr:ATP-binding protein [Alicyclobacillus sp. SO9]QQE77281.1 ATP-binding protein [Alicyclobacillus sp. SO9]
MAYARPESKLRIGSILEVDGTHVIAELDSNIDELTRVHNAHVYSIGQYGSILKIYFGERILFMFVSRLRLKTELEGERGSYTPKADDSRILEADLFGEGVWATDDSGKYALKFERGVSTYPLPQQSVYLTTSTELKDIYRSTNSEDAIPIGTYVGSASVQCFASIDDLFGKHSAILGSTGSGKSAAVSVLLHAVQNFRISEGIDWHPHIIILDPHDEYSTAFPNAARLVSDEGSLHIPYWLLNLQELLDLFIGKTEFQATSQTNILKNAIQKSRVDGTTNLNIDKTKISVDSPVPFSLETLIQYIKDDMPPQPSKQDKHQSLLNKIDALRRDSRLSFLMNEWSSESDEISVILSQFINRDDPMRIVDLSGIPSDVGGIIAAVISRLLFMYKLWQKPDERKGDPVLIVCEEAHRYVPNRGEAEYTAAQDAIRRIAKEGRKYGLGLLLVSQRPSELEATVLSQCNTWLVLRLTNSEDQAHVIRFLPDSLRSLTKVLPGLRRREAIFVGQAAPVPARILMDDLESWKLPRSQDISFLEGWRSDPVDGGDLDSVIERWRYQVRTELEGGSPGE